MSGDSRWWREAVCYEVYVPSFGRGRPVGAGGGLPMAGGRPAGDLAGIRAHLDHLAWLGIDVIWLTPFYPSPLADFGYDVADYCDVNPLFGSLADFDMNSHDSFSTGNGSNVPDGEKLSFGAGNHQVTRVLLPRVEVIAVGDKTSTHTTSSDSGDDTATSDQAKTLTVAVNQDDAERLIHAVQTGTLCFALLDDNSNIKPGAGVNNSNLFP